MKKSIKTLFIIAAIAASTLTASAVKPSYRGFGEFGLAFGPSSPAYSYNQDKESDGVAINFATSHGVQLNRMFYVGAGIGVNNIVRNGYDDFAQLAIFLDGRWDMNLAKKISPFVDLRLGFASNFDSEELSTIFKNNPYFIGEETNYIDGNQQPCNQFYIQPTIGVRFRLHHHIGLNVGLTYFNRKRIDVIYEYTNLSSIQVITDIKTWYKNQFGFIISLDF